MRFIPLHVATFGNDLELIKNLLNSGQDVNEQDSLGITTLHFALYYDRYKVAKLLLDTSNEINICIADAFGYTPLEILMSKDRLTIQEYAPLFVQYLNKSNVDAATKAEVLLKARCTFDMIVRMNDLEVSKAVLKIMENNIESLSKYESELAIKLGMHLLDVGNIEFIFHKEPRDEWVSKIFYERLILLLQSTKIHEVKPFIERLINWNIIDCNNAIRSLDLAFQMANKDALQVFFENKIVEYVRGKFGVDLRVSIFGNTNVNAIEILKDQDDFEVNSRGVDQRTALHFAVDADLIENVHFLLDAGVNVEYKDENDKTALFYCVVLGTVKVAKLLLAYDADVRDAEVERLTLLRFAGSRNPSTVTKLLIARLALLQDCNRDFGKLHRVYESCCEQLETLKKCWTADAVSLYSILVKKIENVAQCNFYDENVMLEIEKYSSRQKMNSLYYSTLKYKLDKATTMRRLKCLIAEVFTKLTGKRVGFDHLVIRNICKFVNLKDLHFFENCN